MLRTVIGTKRTLTNDALEDWVQWMIRSIRKAEDMMREHGVKDWVTESQEENTNGLR